MMTMKRNSRISRTNHTQHESGQVAAVRSDCQHETRRHVLVDGEAERTAKPGRRLHHDRCPQHRKTPVFVRQMAAQQ